MQTLSLDGNWELVHFQETPPDCRSGVPPLQPRPEGVSWEGAVAARVPGNVELDLRRAGALPDLYHGDNVHLLRPFEFHEWWYRRPFEAPRVAPGQRVDLVFEGLDCFAQVWVNGEAAGDADNMLVGHRFDVPSLLASGQNELVVRLGSAVNAARKHQPDPCEGHLPTNWEFLCVRKAAHMGGWDIAPRIVSAGIWRSVRLEIHEPTEIVDLYYYTQQADATHATLGVHYHFVTDAPVLDGFALRFTGQCGDSQFATEVPARFVSGQCSVGVPNPRLWWPKGYGEPNLYEVTCELRHDGEVVHSRTDRVGLRDLKLRRTEITTQEAGGPYQYRVKLMADQIYELFGVAPDNLADFALASQISQAEAKKFFVEITRLRKWRRTGVLWWNVLDCWPQFSEAIVDYYYGKKLAYHYLRRVQQPVCLMIDEPESWHCRVVAGNDSRQPAEGRFRIWDADSGETLLEGEFRTQANENQELGRLRLSHGDQRLFLLEWEVAGRTFGNHYLLGTPPVSLARYRAWLEAIASLPDGFEAASIAK
ncbi:MAG: hypothetical protein COZ57_13300 [Armatimonadetes bacterium CG_4_8_14_3_um_filter_66_20]|nr:MAG: hypothetical protein COZ57_13300 [Armatimonadetes bacterium CG_4_8_14_3_um_filter_66_20]